MLIGISVCHLSYLQLINSIIQMGAKSSANSIPDLGELHMLPMLPDTYVQTQQQPSILQHPEQPSLQTYIILLNSDDIPNCINSLRFRRKYPDQLIQIMYGKIQQNSKQYTKIKVYAEHIILNLQNFINLHFYDLMSIFHKVFKAFKILYLQFGSFAPDPRMIGFNQRAQVKVWAHVKYTKPKPHISYQMYDEQKMIESLIEIFSNKVDIGTIPMDSHRRKFNLKAKTFDQAIQLIQSQVESLDLIPKSIKSIADLYASGRKINENQIISMNSEYYNKTLDKTVKFNYAPPDPSSLNKPKINFTFAGQRSTLYDSSFSKTNMTSSTSRSRPKVNFVNSNPNVNFTINQPANYNQSSENSRLTIKVNFNNSNVSPNVEQNYMIPTQRNNRSRSLVKFTYN